MVINLLGDQEVSVKYIRRGVKHRVGYFHANLLVYQVSCGLNFIFEVRNLFLERGHSFHSREIKTEKKMNRFTLLLEREML